MIQTLCCFVGLIFLVMALLAITYWTFREGEEEEPGLAIVGVILLFGVFIMFFSTIVAFATIEHRADAEERTITIVDKWQENENYYFTDECENVYMVFCGFDGMHVRDCILYKRYNPLIVNEEYTIEVLSISGYEYRLSINELRKGEMKEDVTNGGFFDWAEGFDTKIKTFIYSHLLRTLGRK